MATKRMGNIKDKAKVNISVPRAELDEALGDGVDLPLTQEEEDFEDFLNSGGPATSWVEFYRLEKDGNFWNYDKQPYSVIKGQGLDDYIRNEHGPGKWQVVLKDTKRRWLTSKIFYIGGKSATQTQAATQTNGKEDLHLQFMREQMAAQQTMMIAMLGAMKGPDVGSMLQAFAAMMPKNDLGTMFGALTTAINSFKPQQENKLEDLKNLAGIIADLRGADGEKKDENTWPALIRDGLSMFAGGAATGGPPQAAVQGRPAIPPGARPVELPAVGTPAPGQPVSSATTTAPVTPAATGKSEIELIREGIAGFKRYARDKVVIDPNFVNQIVNSYTPEYLAVLKALDQGATLEMLCLFDPEISSDTMLNAWFKELYEKLTRELYMDPEAGGAILPPVDTGRPRWYRNNAANNANGGPSGQPESGSVELSEGASIHPAS